MDESDERFDLCLQIINREQEPEKGELSRESSECCFTYLIKPTSELFDFITQGRVSLKKYTEIYLLNSVPSIIEHGLTKLVVFSHCGVARSSKVKQT